MPRDFSAALITAISTAMPATIHGKIFALADRPNPNEARSPCTYMELNTDARPSRGPVYRWYPMSWMTPASDISGLLRLRGLRGEQLGDAVPPLIDSVQWQIQVGDRLENLVVRVIGVQWHEQEPSVLRDLQVLLGQRGQQLVLAFADLDGEHIGGGRHRGDPVGAQQPAALDRDERVADP